MQLALLIFTFSVTFKKVINTNQLSLCINKGLNFFPEMITLRTLAVAFLTYYAAVSCMSDHMVVCELLGF